MYDNFFSKLVRKCLKPAYVFIKLYFKIKRPITLGVVGLIFNEAGEILLERLSYRKGWYLPAGGVKKGESVEDALCREMREELALHIEVKDLEFKGIIYHRCEGKHDHAVLFKVKSYRELPKPDYFEVEEIRFFKPDSMEVYNSVTHDLAEKFKTIIISCGDKK